MNENNRTNPAQEQNTYQTGNTRPPKSHRGLIAVLMVLVIFLGGIVSVLGLMNIKLFRQLQELGKPENASLHFTPDAAQQATAAFDDDFLLPVLGFSGQEISSFDQLSYRIPLGLYITHVAPDSDADRKGVLEGDILIALNGKRVINIDDLQALLSSLQEGQTASILLYRNGHQYALKLRLGGA